MGIRGQVAGPSQPILLGSGPYSERRKLKANLDSPRNFGKQDDKPKPWISFPEDATGQHVLGMTGGVQEFCADIYKPYGKLDSDEISSKTRWSIVATPLFPRATNSKSSSRGDRFSGSRVKRRHTCVKRCLRAESDAGDIGFRVVIECPPEDGKRSSLAS